MLLNCGEDNDSRKALCVRWMCFGNGECNNPVGESGRYDHVALDGSITVATYRFNKSYL